MRNRIICCILLLLGSITMCYGQSEESIFINKSESPVSFKDFVSDVENKHDIHFFYKEYQVEDIAVSTTERISLEELLTETLKRYKLTLIRFGDNWIIINEQDNSESVNTGNEDIDKTDYEVIGDFRNNENGANVKISGHVRGAKNSEALIGAQVSSNDSQVGTITDHNGYYAFTAAPGKYTFTVSYLGYEPKTLNLDIRSDSKIDFELFNETLELNEITISATVEDFNVKNVEAGKEVLSLETIKTLPAFLGEVDPVKTITSLPGVSAVGEGTAGFNVRGGEAGQNLLMQDNALLYTSSHMFGLFSLFNSDLVSDVTLYKGGGPSNYGGRVSSVMNVNLKEGNTKEYHASGGVGLASSRLMIEGPIKEDKTSFIIGGRASYAGWLLKKVENIELQQSAASFYDANVKLKHIINRKNVLHASSYITQDRFEFASDTAYSWQTKNAALEWDHIFSNKLSSSLQFIASNYSSEVSNDEELNGFYYNSSITNYNLKLDFNYLLNTKHNIDFGINSLMYQYSPGQLDPYDTNPKAEAISLDKETGIENAVYVSDQWTLNPSLSIQYGLRYSRYTLYGATTYEYLENQPRSADTIIDTLAYNDGSAVQTYDGFEPRVSVRQLINSTNSVKLSYYRTIQYVHLLSNSTSISPVDIWKSTGPYIKPAIGDQFTVGYFKNLADNTFELSLEGFYKEVHNIVDYKDGANILLNKNLEADILQGFGRSYGIEFLLRKNKGRLNGWLAYTYSRSERLFNSESFESNSINKGEYYPANYDTPHNLSVVLSYKLSRRFSVGATFNYATGRPITVPVSKYRYDDIPAVLNFSERNQFRMPDYHRLDLSITLKSGYRKEKLIDGEWVFSVYNVYGRRNPYSVFFTQRGTAYRLSVLGSVFPSLTYNFKI